MRILRSFGGLAAALIVLCRLHGQTSPAQVPGARMLISATSVESYGMSGDILREIDDPNNGDRWLLMRNPAHPSGPARLVLTLPGRRSRPESFRPGGGLDPALPGIRSGDRVLVEEHSVVADARFEAVAMGSARPGGELRVRLAAGGKILSAIALAPGRALVREPIR